MGHGLNFIDSDQGGGGRGITGERRGRVKQGNTNKGLTGMDKVGRLTVGWGWDRREQRGKEWGNCN